jgi:peroxiredoxin
MKGRKMTIKPGDSIPSGTLYMMGADGPTSASTDDFFKGKKVAMFGLPGAFTPTCSAQHVPSYLSNAAALKEKSVDSIICLSVNDAFVLGAWAKDQGVGDNIIMAGDGSGLLTKAMGLEFMSLDKGIRCQRFSMIVDDGVVSVLNHEAAGEYRISSAENMLNQL